MANKGKGERGIRGIQPVTFDLSLLDIKNASACEKMMVNWEKFKDWESNLSEDEKDYLDFAWEEFWARENQKEPVRDFEPHKSNPHYFIWLLLMGRGGGKRLSLDTEIPTPFGWKIMADLKVGDKVFDDNGEPCNVTFVSEVCDEPDLYKVIFDDGNYVIADAEHQWWCYDFRARVARQRYKNPRLGPKVVNTLQIKDTLKYRNHDANWAVELTGPVRYPGKSLPLHPYYLGVWLAQVLNSFNEICIYNKDVEIIENIREIGYDVVHRRDSPKSLCSIYKVNIDLDKNLKYEMMALNLTGIKHIPDIYLQSSVKQRVQLLRGFMDVWGEFTKDNFCYVEIKDDLLAKDFIELLTSLGIKVNVNKRKDTIIADNGWISFSFTPHNFRLFTLPRKVLRQKKSNIRATTKYRYIVAVEKVESKPARCISVDSQNNTYLCTRNFIPTHNTRTGAEWIRKRVESGLAKRIALVARSPADARDVMIKGPSGILEISKPDFYPRYEPSNRRLVWPNGAQAIVFSSYEPDQLRGPQFDTAWCDELAAWKYLDETWNNLMLGMRLKYTSPKVCITTTPRPLALIREMMKDPKIPKSLGSTFSNQAFLSENYLDKMKEVYDGTRLGQQELYGEVLGDVEGALWTAKIINESRIDINLEPDKFPGNSIYERKMEFILKNIVRVVIGVDPQMVGGSDPDSGGDNCETGIIVAGIDAANRGYILEDLSGNMTPLTWAKTVVNAFHKYKADRIIVEANQGGDLPETTIRQIDENVSFKKVIAKKGKYTRAEPISALYERGKICHFGTVEEYAKLETQMINWVPGNSSPDRMDALVYALSELMLDSGPSYSVFIDYNKKNYILENSSRMFDNLDFKFFGKGESFW